MNMYDYDFTEAGVKAMYDDCLELVSSVMESEDFDSLLEGININISIGDKRMIIPICAEAFEKLFDYIKEAEREDKL